MIPFVRTFPNGSRIGIQIARPEAIELVASRFVKLGGRYQIAMLPENKIKLAVTIPAGGGNDGVVEEIETTNDEALPKAIDQLVRLSDLHVREMWLADASDLPRGTA